MTFRDLIKNWPTVAEFAIDIGVKPSTGRAMWLRNSVAVAHWEAVIKAAKKRGVSVTMAQLAEMAVAGRFQKETRAA